MTCRQHTSCNSSAEVKSLQPDTREKILVFQQDGNGERKIQGIWRYAKELFEVEIISVNDSLPPVLDDTTDYLPSDIQADLVLDFLQHPDLSYDLAVACSKRSIPVVASGKKLRVDGAFTPPT